MQKKLVPSKRNIPVDTLRGLACILLVAYHVIGVTPESGLRLHDGILKNANELLAYIRMPLFTFLSGFVYAWRPYNRDCKKFVKGKFRRLIVPMLVVGTAFAFFQSITPGTNAAITDWRYIHLMPVAHYWFVESLFLIFMVLIPLEHFSVLDSKTGLAIVFLIASLLFVFNVGTPWLSIAGAAYLFPYFLIGLYCSRFPIDFQFKRAAGTTFLLIVILFLVFYGIQYAGGRRSFIALLIGTISCVSLLYIRFESVLLSSIGFYSYPIYLLHVFFTAASRIVFKSAGVTNIWILFILGTVIGLAGPIIVELFASKFPLSRIPLPGKAPFKKAAISEAVTT